MRNDNKNVSFYAQNNCYDHPKSNSNYSQVDIIPDLSLFQFPVSENIDNDSESLLLGSEMMECIQNLKEEDFLMDNSDKKLVSSNEDHLYPSSLPDSIRNYFEVITVSIDAQIKTKTVQLGPLMNEKQVRTHSDIVTVKLKGLWYDTLIELNDKVFLSILNLNYSQSEKCYLLDDAYGSSSKSFPSSQRNNSQAIQTIENFIVIEPELLLSPSIIKFAFPCTRKAFFNEEFKFILGSDLNKYNLIGTISHRLFETMFIRASSMTSQTQLTSKLLEAELEVIMKDYMLDIALLDLQQRVVLFECKAYFNQIIKFFKDFYFSGIGIEGLRVSRYISSEQLYQSQVLGMKGVIDILLQTSNEKGTREITPLELKTGNYQSNSDVMQVLIYCLILSDQLGSTSSNGLLYYLKKDNAFRVKVTLNDIINVIVVRNNIAKYILKYENTADIKAMALPPVCASQRECEGCFRRSQCKAHYDLFEAGDSSVGQPEEVTEYFKYFHRIINNEQALANRELRNRYLKLEDKPELSEFKKYSISKVTDDNIHSLTIDIEKETESIREISLMKEEEDRTPQKEEIASQYNEIRSNYVVYDPECKRAFKGVVMNKGNKGQFKLNVLKHRLDENLLQYFALLQREQHKGIPLNAFLYLKDIDSLTKFSYKLMRGNLLSLCSFDASPLIERLRRKIIFLDSPTYRKDVEFQETIINYIKAHFLEKYIRLNQDQKKALIKSLLCEDYTLILGFPGSGKTTVIALLVEILASMKKKVLVTAYTNLAVDNILLKLKQEAKTAFCRIGSNADAINKDIHPFLLSNCKFNSVAEWKVFLANQYVYAATTSGISNKLLLKMQFDYCIVDEACQVFEPNLLGPLMLSSKFILVGDPFQLKALLKTTSSSSFAPTSLFERLLKAHESMAVQLELQYRMNESILHLSNECVYENVMKCANDSIAHRRIQLDVNKLTQQGGSVASWVNDVIDPNKQVVFVDYSELDDKSYFDQVIDSNVIEANIIKELMRALANCKFNMNSIGVLTPYKAQEELLKRELKQFQFDSVFTIDKSQGMEKEVIIISFVKTNAKTRLLKDIARINVAFTRPRAKLIIIGLRNVLIDIERLASYINQLIKRKWVYSIDKSSIKPLLVK